MQNVSQELQVVSYRWERSGFAQRSMRSCTRVAQMNAAGADFGAVKKLITNP